MIGAKVKEGNVRRTISIPESLDKKIRTKYTKQGDFSRVIIEAVEAYIE
jgi:hypothetical protein